MVTKNKKILLRRLFVVMLVCVLLISVLAACGNLTTVTADKTALQSAITSAESVKAAADYSEYTEETRTAFEDALNAAKTVDNDANATQTKIDDAKNNLIAAQNNLTAAAIDKTDLQSAIASADAVKAANDYSEYTQVSRTAFEDALAAAKTVNNNQNATQYEINTAKNNLINAQDSLTVITVPPAGEDEYPSEYSDHLLILQAYGTGGKTDAAATHSFIELYNPTDNDVDLTGYSVQYAKSKTNWSMLELEGSIKAHSSFLVLGKQSAQEGCNLILTQEEADMLWDIEFDNNNFKVCLLLVSELLAIENPFDIDGDGTKSEGYIDLFGGADSDNAKSIDGYETNYPYILSKQKAARRYTLIDTDDNAADFGGIDYRADKISDELKERYRPKNSGYGEWNPVSALSLSGANQYTAEIFKEDTVIDINITISQANRSYMKANATKEEYVSCDISVAGLTYENVGIRPKGNSTLQSLAKTDTERFSFKVKFNEYVKGQKLLGLKKIVLNCGYQDKTFIKEYESYKSLKALGVPVPAFTWAKVSLNGEYFGLYFVLEDIDDSFVERYYGANIQYTVYKPESLSVNAQGTNLAGTLKYLGENTSSYGDVFNNVVCTSGNYDNQKSYINMTKVLASGTDLKSILNVDEILRYTAALNYLVNLDSYIGQMYHNYYLVEVNGIFSIIPWDFNLSYAGFGANSASNAVNYPIDKVYSSSSASDSPLTAKVINSATKEAYRSYIKFLADYNAANAAADIDAVASLIDALIQSDPTKHSTYAEFTKGTATLKQFISDRNKSVYAQLAGTQSSTSYGNISTSVTLSDMGSAMGGNAGGPGGKPGWN